MLPSPTTTAEHTPQDPEQRPGWCDGGWLLSEQEPDPLERAVDLARGGKHAGVAKKVPDHQYGFDRGEQLAPLFVIDRGGW